MRLNRSTLHVLATGLLVLPTPATAAPREPVSLAPAGRWVSDWGDNRCMLLRSFGTGDDAIAISLTRYGPGDSFELRAYGKPFSTMYDKNDYEVDFGPEPDKHKVSALLGTVGDKPMVHLGSVFLLDSLSNDAGNEERPLLTPDQEAAVTSLTIRVSSRRSYRLETGPMAAPMRAIRTCLDAMYTAWGYDPGAVAQWRQPPRPVGSTSSWLTTNDYPEKEASRGGQGVLSYRLDIDPTGNITDCHVTASTKGEFGDRLCVLLKRRARISPALDGNGRPTRGFFIGIVKWILPG